MRWAGHEKRDMKNSLRWLFGLLLLLPLASCGQARPVDEYSAFLRANLVTDRVFNFNTLSSDLIVRILLYGPEAENRASLLFHDDPVFIRETGDWGRASGGKRLIVLMGLYAPDPGEKDAESGRLRPLLAMENGQVLRAAEIVRHGRDSAFARDYFPAFSPWEDLFAVKFDLPENQGRASEFILKWPGGTQRLPLSKEQGF